MWRHLLHREISLKLSALSDVLYPIIFFVMTLVVFPLAMGTDKALLSKIAVPSVWIAALFAIILSTQQIFTRELNNGVFAQICLSSASLTLWVMLKLGVHWLATAGVLVLVSALVIPLYGLAVEQATLMMLTLLLATPTLLLLSALASVLVISLSSANSLVAIIAIPLQIPVVMLAIGVVTASQLQFSVLPLLAILLACLILAVMLIPLSIAFILKSSY